MFTKKHSKEAKIDSIYYLFGRCRVKNLRGIAHIVVDLVVIFTVVSIIELSVI